MIDIKSLAGCLLAVSLSSHAIADDSAITVGITPELKQFSGKIDGKKIRIIRNQDTGNMVDETFARTSRACPPFCIQPMTIAAGVETIGELELIDYIKQRSAGNKQIVLIDSRDPDWKDSGTIPGAINIPWQTLNPSAGADPITIADLLTETFGVTEYEGLWNFTQAKTLILFCNGAWCGQSPNNIKNLLRFGYPADKIKWYRGGMQNWEILGFEKAFAE